MGRRHGARRAWLCEVTACRGLRCSDFIASGHSPLSYPGRSAALLQRCAAEPGPMSPHRACCLLGPGSAPHRFALRRVRDTRAERAAASHPVIASADIPPPSLRGALATKQSRLSPRQDSGLLPPSPRLRRTNRCARNDDGERHRVKMKTGMPSFRQSRPPQPFAGAPGIVGAPVGAVDRRQIGDAFAGIF